MKLDAIAMDITVTQQGDHYIVSGKDAAGLHAKMQGAPAADMHNMVVGALVDGRFTLQKMAEEKQAANG